MATSTLAVVVLIAGPLGRRLNAVRRRLDPDGLERIPAHIPLVEPFEARPPLQPLERRLWQACHDQPAFWVDLGALASDDARGLVYAEVVAGAEELVALRDALAVALDAPPATGEPRLVLAQPSRAQDRALARREAAGQRIDASFYCERVELLARYPDGAWYERDFYTLDRAVVRA